MFDKIKRIFTSKNQNSNNVIEHLDNENFRNIRANKQGSEIIKLTITTFIKAMEERYPEWRNLFVVSLTGDGDVAIWCLKGFDDKITKQAIPCIWRRKTFIENCMLCGVEKIAFFDYKNKTFDLLKINEIDVSKLP